MSSAQRGILLFSTLLMAGCAIAYELLASSISSYFFGSSVIHFSLTIGLFLSFMGLGSYLTKFVLQRELETFLFVEIVLALVGGFSSFILYWAFTFTSFYYVVAFILIAVIGTMIGFEVPILTHLIAKEGKIKDAMADVLSLDYIGSLVASIVFALILLPALGLLKTAFFFGFLNLMIASATWLSFSRNIAWTRATAGVIVASFVLLGGGFLYADPAVSFFESKLYQDEILYTEQSTYQRIVLTKYREDFRMYLDGNLQFSSMDEYRYHEALVHVPMGLSRNHERVLLLGAGDGLAVRELLKYEDIEEIVVVDLDPAVTQLAQEHPLLLDLNEGALSDPRVTLVHEDAYNYLEEGADRYSVIIADLPDPNNLALGKLYSSEFYHLAEKRLAEGGVMVTQATSPYFAREAFWSIDATMADAFDATRAYTVYVPSFGEWGFVLAGHPEVIQSDAELSVETDFLQTETLGRIFEFSPDTSRVDVDMNSLNDQVLVRYYEQALQTWF